MFYYAAPAKVTRDETRRAANDVNNRHTRSYCCNIYTVPIRVILYIFPKYINIGISVWTGMFMIETKSVDKFVNNRPCTGY